MIAALLAGIITAGGLSGTPGGARAADPAPPVRDFGALSYLGRPTVDAAGHVSVPQPKRRSATAADADRIAVETKQRSFVDPTTLAASTPPRTPPPLPGSDADECLDNAGSHSALGRVHNRFLWCQRWQLIAIRGTGSQPGGIKLAEMTMNYDAVAYGRDDGRRGVTIFFRSRGFTFSPEKGYIRENAMLYQKIDCTGDPSAERPSTGAGCDSPGSFVGQRLDRWDDTWTSWTISSDASVSQAADRVLLHQWQFHGYVVDSFNYRLPDSLGEKHTVRCDSATIFGKRRSGACINDDVIPHLQYNRNDSNVGEVARHIACAQEAPTCFTYPNQDTGKLIPGKFDAGRRLDSIALHRVRSAKTNSPIADANRAVVRRECQKLPISVYDTSKGQQCDEYPFASTVEGAACCALPAFDWDFSILGVDGTVNECAGRALKKYYRDDRILYQQDGFFVEITDGPPAGPQFCDAIPPEEDEPDDDGGEPAPDLPPTVSAGPDVSGEEGRPVALNGSASDPEIGTPNVIWSWRALSGVDAGASCSFTSTATPGTSVTCTDDGVFEVTLTAYDGVNPGVADSALVRLTNVSPDFAKPRPDLAPRRTATSAAAADEPPENPGIVTPTPWQVFRKGDAVSLEAGYTEPAENDTHTCVTAWDDGTTSTYAGADLTCRATHTFTRAGMFTIRTTVTDDDGDSGSDEVMVVVYDPDGGWANVDGSYDSPAGALTGSPTVAGEAWLHLAGHYYPQDKSTPLGATRNWLPGNPYRFDIATPTLQWLVVTPDGKIAAKATGTLAGSSAKYGIVFYAYEGCAPATRPGACQNGPDRVRTVVWPLAKGDYPTGDVFYDSRASAGYDVDVADPLPMRTGQTLIQWP